ncbi:MAG: hypothetical protein C5B53_02370 [Candidatus Melainabacteria bacterium]|nr:MAG: hypothetical protein C5B53_02370 [Candidatus Melainabacteria bacterium]
MEKAQKSKSLYVELPYCTPENGMEYLLSIQDRPKEDTTEWRLVLFSPAGDQTLWHYASRDLTLICNLISTSCGGDLMKDMMLAGPSALSKEKLAAAAKANVDESINPFYTAPNGANPAPAANPSQHPAANPYPAPAANPYPAPAANSYPAPAANSYPAPAANSYPAPAANSYPAPAANWSPAPSGNPYPDPAANPSQATVVNPLQAPDPILSPSNNPVPAPVITPVSRASSADTAIVFEPPRPEAKATLQGDLQQVAINNLLLSISQSQLSGRLDIRTRTEKSEVYFAEGKAIHCTVKETIGNNALIELVSWRSGEYRFWDGERTSLKTINKEIEALIGQGLAIVDQARYLDNNGLRPESCLVKRSAMISEDELKDRLSKGVPFDLDEQVDFYATIDNRKPLFELLKERPISKSAWVPILFNLVSMGLVQISDQPLLQNRLANLRSLGVDEAAVQHIGKGLLRTDSGILSFPAFIYLLDQEYLRYEFFNLPFSLVAFSIGQRNNETGQVYALQMLAIRRAMQRISLVKRQVDLLGHYGEHDYALLLPSTNSAAATALAHRIVDVLKEAPLSSDVDTRSLALAFGVATVPEDCHEMDKLLLAATKARDLAKSSNRIVVQSREIIGQVPLS